MATSEGPIAAQRRRNAQLTEQATRLTAQDETARSLPRSLPVILLPANTRDTEPLPDGDRAAFLEGLRRALSTVFGDAVRDNAAPMSAQAAAERDDAATVPASADSADRARATMLAGGCTACRGECCTAGGTHAFLREDSLIRVRAHLAETGATVTADSLLATYAGYLPARHYRGSCVFHTTEACALPRSLRANLCNRYLCGGLTQLERALDATGHQAAYVAAADTVHLRRLAHVSADGVRPLSLKAGPAGPT